MASESEILRRLNALRQAATDYVQMANAINGSWESRMAEIASLEMRRDKIKQEIDEVQKKANTIIQTASEEAAVMRNEARRLLEDAKRNKLAIAEDTDHFRKVKAEAEAMLKDAQEKQKTVSQQWQVIELRRKKLEEATRV